MPRKITTCDRVFREPSGSAQDLGFWAHGTDRGGQFVGWSAIPERDSAESGFEVLQETLSGDDLRVNLRTRDEPFPTEWMNR